MSCKVFFLIVGCFVAFFVSSGVVSAEDNNLINGVCGLSNGKTFSSTPVVDLCLSGTPSLVLGPNPGYWWYCEGANNGIKVSCRANYLSTGSLNLVYPTGGENWEIGKTYTVLWNYSNLKDVHVNISNNKSYSCEQGVALAENKQLTFTIGRHCASASLSSGEKYIEPGVHTVILYGHDLNGKVINATMSPGKIITISSEVVAPPVNGVCGSASGSVVSSVPVYNFCSLGIVSSVSGSGPWNWSCIGSNGGVAAMCSASSTESYIELLNPKKGESLKQGSNYLVKYFSSGYSPETTFPIYLSGNSNLYRLIGTIYLSKDSFNFTVPSDLLGSGFQLSIPGESMTEVFSIVSISGSSFPAHSQCGSVNGTTISSIPTTNLCSSGKASAVSGFGPWYWTCSEQNTESASCSAGIKNGTVNQPTKSNVLGGIVLDKPLNQMNREELMKLLVKLIMLLSSKK